MYLGWYDADKKVPITAKVDEALKRYHEKFGSSPDTILMGTAGVDDVRVAFGDSYRVKALDYILPNTIYVGVSDTQI